MSVCKFLIVILKFLNFATVFNAVLAVFVL